MYYIFASLVVGAFIGGSTLLNQPVPSQHATSHVSSATIVDRSVSQNDSASPIVDNQALSAEANLSLSL